MLPHRRWRRIFGDTSGAAPGFGGRLESLWLEAGVEPRMAGGIVDLA